MVRRLLKTAPTLSSPLHCIRPRPSGSCPLPEGEKTDVEMGENRQTSSASSEEMSERKNDSPMPEKASAPPGSPSSVPSSRSSGPSPLPEENKTFRKMEERRLVNTAVSKGLPSVLRHSPSPQAVPALPKAERVGVRQAIRSVFCGNKPKPASFTQVTPSALHGTISKAPAHIASSGTQPESARSPQAPFFSRRGVHPIAPATVKGEHTKTAREQSRTLRPSAVAQRIASGPSALGLKVNVNTRRHVSINVVSKDRTSDGQHAQRIQTVHTLSKSLPVCPTRAMSNVTPRELDLNDRLMMSLIRYRGRTYQSRGRQSLLGLILLWRENIQKNVRISCRNSSIEFKSLDLGLSVRHRLNLPVHPPNAPDRADIFSAQGSQVEHETEVMPSSGLLDTVAALVRARLAARSARDEFDLQYPRGPHDRLLEPEERHDHAVNKLSAANVRGSPLPETTLSLPETPPAALSQVPIPCPGSNGHKPRFDEGETDWEFPSLIKLVARMEMRLPCSRAVCSLPERVFRAITGPCSSPWI